MPIADPFRLVWTPFLKKVDGRMGQAVGLVCPTVLGSGGDFTLEMGGRRCTAKTLDLLRYGSESRDQDLPVTYLWMAPRPHRPSMWFETRPRPSIGEQPRTARMTSAMSSPSAPARTRGLPGSRS